MTDSPVGIRPEINSHTPREKLFRVRLSPSLSLSRPRARPFPIPFSFAPHLLSFFPRCTASPSPYRSPDSLLMVHIGTTHTIKRERDGSPAIGSLLHTRVRHGIVSIAVPNTRSSCLDFKNTNSRRGKYENEIISGHRLFIIQSVILVLTIIKIKLVLPSRINLTTSLSRFRNIWSVH